MSAWPQAPIENGLEYPIVNVLIACRDGPTARHRGPAQSIGICIQGLSSLWARAARFGGTHVSSRSAESALCPRKQLSYAQ
jgi:hypothetical protein